MNRPRKSICVGVAATILLFYAGAGYPLADGSAKAMEKSSEPVTMLLLGLAMTGLSRIATHKRVR